MSFFPTVWERWWVPVWHVVYAMKTHDRPTRRQRFNDFKRARAAAPWSDARSESIERFKRSVTQ
jgi:hypothetical protein